MVISRDIQVNRRLLDINFLGYKLDNSPLPLYEIGTADIDIVRPTEEQYSFLQQREFSLYNHLHNDPWNTNAVYFVYSDKKIMKSVSNSQVENVLQEPYCVWEIPFVKSGSHGDLNVSIYFASANVVVVCNGSDILYILCTGDRKPSGEQWRLLHSESIAEGMKVCDARIPTNGHLHCLCCHVGAKQTFITHFYFMCEEKEKWRLEHSAQMSGKGSVDYVALDRNCQKAIVIGQIDAKTQEFIMSENQKPSEVVKETSFEWQQNYDEVKVWLVATDGSSHSVTVSANDLLVKSAAGNIILQGTFYRPIENGLSVWQYMEREGKRTLEVVLSKMDEGSMWPKIFDTSNFLGKEIHDAELVHDIHNKLAHLTSETEDVGGATVLNSGQLEECDITDCEGRTLIEYDLSSILMAPIFKTELGNGQWLMVSPPTIQDPPRFCLRSDVDGLIYDVGGEAPKHIATLCAYGYIQASKTSRVFSFLPADFTYCGLVDADGRVFIYRGGVRPFSAKKDWGSQYLVSLGKKKIFGIYATGKEIFILSENNLHLIKFTVDLQ